MGGGMLEPRTFQAGGAPASYPYWNFSPHEAVYHGELCCWSQQKGELGTSFKTPYWSMNCYHYGLRIEKLVPSRAAELHFPKPWVLPKRPVYLEMVREILFPILRAIISWLDLSLKQSPDLEISHKMYVIRYLGEAYGPDSWTDPQACTQSHLCLFFKWLHKLVANYTTDYNVILDKHRDSNKQYHWQEGERKTVKMKHKPNF